MSYAQVPTQELEAMVIANIKALYFKLGTVGLPSVYIRP